MTYFVILSNLTTLQVPMAHLEQDYGISYIIDIHRGQEEYFVQLGVSYLKRNKSLIIESAIFSVIY